MVELIIVILIITLVIYGYINQLNNSLKEKENEITKLKKKVVNIKHLSEVLSYSDYGISYLIEGLNFQTKFKDKSTQDISEILEKYPEPRIEIINHIEQKNRLINLLQYANWNDVANLEFILLAHGIITDTDLWESLVEKYDFDFIYLPGFKPTLDENLEMKHVGVISKGVREIPCEINKEMLIPIEYSGNFNWEKLLTFHKAQYIIFQYFRNKNKLKFNKLSTVYDVDELLSLDDGINVFNEEDISARYNLKINIKGIIDEIPEEMKKNNFIYISSYADNVFDALVAKDASTENLPACILNSENKNSLTTRYILQHIGEISDRIIYVQDTALVSLKNTLKEKRRKITYEKQIMTSDNYMITVFISSTLNYYDKGEWKSFEKLIKELKKS